VPAHAKLYRAPATVDREHGGVSVAVTAVAMVESCSPCGHALRKGAPGEEKWVARLWARWIGRWRRGGGVRVSGLPWSLYHNTRIGAGRSDAKSGYSVRRSDAKNI
jgi:hypothetical protein